MVGQVDTIRLREARLREATPPDAAALGALHVAAWRGAYAGILPPSLLDGLSSDRSAAMWRAVLDDPPGHGDAALFVAESGDDTVASARASPSATKRCLREGWPDLYGRIAQDL